MNIARGLFRGWVVVSALWVAGTLALGMSEAPREIAYPYWQYSAKLKDNGKTNPFDRDWSAPYYTNFHSPSVEGLDPAFAVLDYQYRSDWDKSVRDGKMIRTDFPDGSKLYLSSALTDGDQNYVAQKFWAGRWWRWGAEAGKWLLIALCPPLALFILGYCGLWVGRGFRAT